MAIQHIIVSMPVKNRQSHRLKNLNHHGVEKQPNLNPAEDSMNPCYKRHQNNYWNRGDPHEIPGKSIDSIEKEPVLEIHFRLHRDQQPSVGLLPAGEESAPHLPESRGVVFVVTEKMTQRPTPAIVFAGGMNGWTVFAQPIAKVGGSFCVVGDGVPATTATTACRGDRNHSRRTVPTFWCAQAKSTERDGSLFA